MSALKLIADRAAEDGLDWLVAGGHAVIAHGYSRCTFDLDLVIRRSQSERWKNLAGALGYVFYHEGPAFLQFNPPRPETLPLDMMLTSDETFANLAAHAVSGPPSAAYAGIVSLKHLIALKCHAIKHGLERRILKDAYDVMRLAQANGLDMNYPEVNAVFLKYGMAEFYETPNAPAEQAEPLTLELPDWSGMDDSPGRVSPDAAFDLVEQYASWFPWTGDPWRKQRPEKCEVEFVL